MMLEESPSSVPIRSKRNEGGGFLTDATGVGAASWVGDGLGTIEGDCEVSAQAAATVRQMIRTPRVCAILALPEPASAMVTPNQMLLSLARLTAMRPRADTSLDPIVVKSGLLVNLPPSPLPQCPPSRYNLPITGRSPAPQPRRAVRRDGSEE